MKMCFFVEFLKKKFKKNYFLIKKTSRKIFHRIIHQHKYNNKLKKNNSKKKNILKYKKKERKIKEKKNKIPEISQILKIQLK